MKLIPNLKKINIKKSILLLSFIAIDQVIKYLAINVFDYYVFNQGISFGFFTRDSGQFWLAFSAFVLLMYVVIKSKINIFYLLLIAGGLSNLIDRVFYGAVVDYINFFDIVWFNLADCYINIGIILIIYAILFEISHNTEKHENKFTSQTDNENRTE